MSSLEPPTIVSRPPPPSIVPKPLPPTIELTPEEPVTAAPVLAGFETHLLPAGGFSVGYRTGQSSVEQVLAAIRAAGLHIKDISTEDPDLEDVFVSLTYAAPEAAQA